MTISIQVDGLLDQAQLAADRGEWQASYDILSHIAILDPNNAGVFTGLGTCLIQMERTVEALPHFQKVIELAPDSPDAHNNLGVAALLAGLFEEAETAYQKALALDPDNSQAWKNLALTYLQQDRMEEGIQILAAVLKVHPQDVDALGLLAQFYEEGNDFDSSRLLYQEVLKYQPENIRAKEGLARIPQPSPDLARIARPEHNRTLANLKELKRIPARPRVAFYGPRHTSTETRLGVAAHGLANGGISTKISLAFERVDLNHFDIFVFANPHCSKMLTEAFETCIREGKQVFVDLDKDFFSLPKHSPEYSQSGPGNTAALRILERILGKCDHVTVPSGVLAERYSRYTRQISVVPYVWDQSNPLWDKSVPHGGAIHIGIMGSHVSYRDAAIMKNELARLVRTYPQLLLAIGGDLKLYESLSIIPEKQRMFIPLGRIEDYPYLLGHFDLLLVPLQNNAYNQSLSDLPLLEAGARRLAWVATPTPAFREWGVGGLFIQGTGDWYRAIRQLIDEPGLRKELGNQGREKALERGVGCIARQWETILI